MNYTELGNNIRKFRKMRGLTQEVLSEKIGITPVFMSQIETASRHPSLETVVKISKELNTSVDMLLFNCIYNDNISDFIDTGLTREQFNIISVAFKKRSADEISALIKAFTYLLDYEEQ